MLDALGACCETHDTMAKGFEVQLEWEPILAAHPVWMREQEIVVTEAMEDIMFKRRAASEYGQRMCY